MESLRFLWMVLLMIIVFFTVMQWSVAANRCKLFVPSFIVVAIAIAAYCSIGTYYAVSPEAFLASAAIVIGSAYVISHLLPANWTIIGAFRPDESAPPKSESWIIERNGFAASGLQVVLNLCILAAVWISFAAQIVITDNTLFLFFWLYVQSRQISTVSRVGSKLLWTSFALVILSFGSILITNFIIEGAVHSAAYAVFIAAIGCSQIAPFRRHLARLRRRQRHHQKASTLRESP